MPLYLCLISLCSLLFVTSPSLAQADRYEVGMHLRLFEESWDKHPAAEGRRRAIKPLKDSFTAFFTMNLGKVAESMDRARYALESADQPSPQVVWADSLAIKPRKRLIDLTADSLELTVEPIYQLDSKKPTAEVKLRIQYGDEKPVEILLEKPRQNVTLKLPASETSADLMLRTVVLLDGKPATEKFVMVSRVKNLADRLKAIETALPMKKATIEAATVVAHYQLLRRPRGWGIIRDEFSCRPLA